MGEETFAGAVREDVAVAEALDAATTFVVRRLASVGEVSLTAATTLATLNRTGPSRITDLAHEKGISQPSMTTLVARLQRQGLVARQADPNDGRTARISITQSGREMLARRRDDRVEFLCRMVSGLEARQREALLAAAPALHSLTEQAAPDTFEK